MSVPATKALSPAPSSTITRMSSSASAFSHASYRPSYIPHVIALRWRGRLKVTVRTPPSASTSSSGSSTDGLLGGASGSAGAAPAAQCPRDDGGSEDLQDGQDEDHQGQRPGEDDADVAVADR